MNCSVNWLPDHSGDQQKVDCFTVVVFLRGRVELQLVNLRIP